MNSFLKSSAVLFLFFASNTLLAQEFKTPLKVTKGEEYNYQTEMVMDINMNQGGMEMKISNSTSSTNKYKVENVLSNGSIDLLFSTWDITTRTQMMGKDTSMSMKGKVSPTYKMLIDKYGNTVTREIVDSSYVKEFNVQLGGENRLMNSGMFCEFPNKDLQIGEKWNKTLSDTISNMGMKLGLTIKTEYILGKVEMFEGKSLQKITFKADIEIGGKGNMQGMDVFAEGTGVSSGTAYIDPVSKVISTSKSNIEMAMTMAISGAQSMTIPINQKITATMKLKK